MATYERDGHTIFFEDSGGDGPAVIFSHGFLMDHTMFDAQVEALAPDYRCIRWDERGFGNTEAKGPFTYWDSADDAVGLLDHLGVDEAVFAGMSQGGFLSLRAALAHPDRVRALVLIDTQPGTEADENMEAYGGMVQGWAHGTDEDRAGIMPFVAGLIINDDALSAEWIAKWQARDPGFIEEPGNTLLTRDDITDRVGEITCPALVVHGTDDTAIPLEAAKTMAAALGDCRAVVEVEGAAHAPNMTHPGVVNPAIRSFLDSL